MRIDELRLTNFRTFASLELELEPELTVLVGRNGSGKSTVLAALEVVLECWIRAFVTRAPTKGSWFVRTTTELHGGVPTTTQHYPVGVRAVASAFPVDPSSAVLVEELGRDAVLRSEDEIGRRGALAATRPDAVLPIVASYAASRRWIAPRKNNASGDRFEVDAIRAAGYRSALRGGIYRRALEAWMAWREQARIQDLARVAEEGGDVRTVRAWELDAVSDAAITCVEGAKRLSYSANRQGLWVEFHDGSFLPFDALSDGQRNLASLAADVARRAIQLNAHLGAEAPKKTPGVVLIDEIELHLHPAWQWRVLEDLRRAFPAVQLVVTTHSPQIMSAAPRGAVRLIDADHHVHKLERVHGKDVHSILEDVFGVRSRERKTQEALEELARKIEEGELVEARRLIEALEDGLGPDDTSLVGARWDLHLAESARAQD